MVRATKWLAGAVLLVVSATVGTADAAPIGRFSIFEDLGFVSLDLTNDSADLTFSDLQVAFCFGSVTAGTTAPPGFASSTGDITACDGALVTVANGFGAGAEIGAGGGLQFGLDVPDQQGSAPSFAFLAMQVFRGQDGPRAYFVDPLALDCSDCSEVIYDEALRQPIPEPATLSLVALAAAMAAWRRRPARV
jgi:hypothetical protein